MSRIVRLAAAAYPLDRLANWVEYEKKLEHWVSEGAQQADLLVFPEYGAMELALIGRSGTSCNLQTPLQDVSSRLAQADAILATLAQRYGVYICSGSGPAFDPAYPEGPVNRARLITPQGRVVAQDKQIMTRWERDPMGAVPGGGLQVFETDLGRIGILICYDAEFPLLGRAMAEAEIILVPSCTETVAGYWRVRIGAMARALENQCVTVMASLTGEAPWTDVADTTIGAGGVFGPPDRGFPDSGVLASGALGEPGWTYARLSLDAIAEVRANGEVLGQAHWEEQAGRTAQAPHVSLRASFA